jgi:hypothetical protein
VLNIYRARPSRRQRTHRPPRRGRDQSSSNGKPT